MGFRTSQDKCRTCLWGITAGYKLNLAVSRQVIQRGGKRNYSGSWGRPHPSPLPGGVFRLSSNHPGTAAAAGIQGSICYLRALPSSFGSRHPTAPVILRLPSSHAAAGIKSPCCQTHGWRMELLPRLPPLVIVALTVLAHSQGPGSPVRRG